MNRLDDLIAQYCPDGVIYSSLDEICTLITDGSHTSPKAVENGYYMPSVKDMTPTGFDFTNCKQISESDYRTLVNNGCKPLPGDLLVAKDGSMLKYAFRVKEESDIVILSSIAIFRPNPLVVDADYLAYYITSKRTKEKVIQDYSTKGGVPRIVLKNFKKIKIPVPPLPVQQEIVRILDSFSKFTKELQEKLQTEFIARKHQYEYYRNKLLSLSPNTTYKTLAELCNISAGGDPPKEEMSREKNERYSIPIISNGIGDNALYGYTNIPRINKVAVTVAARGTIGYAEYRDYAYYPVIRLLSVIPKDASELNTRYLYYCLQGKEYNLPTSGIPQLTAPMLQKVEIPIPPRDTQDRIVRILDKFNAIYSCWKNELPAEIEARQKQYEYYRDKLLSFKEA